MTGEEQEGDKEEDAVGDEIDARAEDEIESFEEEDGDEEEDADADEIDAVAEVQSESGDDNEKCCDRCRFRL